MVFLTNSRAFAQDLNLPSPTRTWTSAGHTKYYVDSAAGNDANDGKSPNHAWQSLTEVNAGVFAPGDWIFLKAGSHWDTFFAPGGSGAAHHPVKVTSYGAGPIPSVDAHAAALATLSLRNQEYWDIENLDITNTSASPVKWLRGVEVSLLDYGTAHDIVLRNLTVHDINSPEDKGNGGSGIFCDNRGDSMQSRFDGLLIEDNVLSHTDRNGITMDSGYWQRTKWYPNLNVVFRGNHLSDIGGDCIVAIGCDGALLEHNTVHGGRMRATDWASGIWVWSCDNSVIQYNECSGMLGQMDAQGFDADWNTRNTVIQYNYSHDNGGGFVMLCNNGDVKPPDNIGNVGTIVRYNISQNDGYRTMTFSGPVTNGEIYNNTIYIGKVDSPILVFAWNWGGAWPSNITIDNNIFDVDGKVTFAIGGTKNIAFDSNLSYGSFVTPPSGFVVGSEDLGLSAPGSGADGLGSVDGYHLIRTSPCLGTGQLVPNNGGRDFWGSPVFLGKEPSVGASQE